MVLSAGQNLKVSEGMEIPRGNSYPEPSRTSLHESSVGNEESVTAVKDGEAGKDRFEWWLFEKYGPTLGMTDLAAVLHHTAGTLDQKVRGGQCPVPTYREGGHRVADIRDLIRYLNQRRKEAQAAYRQQQDLLKLPKGL